MILHFNNTRIRQLIILAIALSAVGWSGNLVRVSAQGASPPSALSPDDDPAQDAPACSVYVRAEYQGSSDGSIARPWKKIAEAIKQARAGATICLEGSFAERIILDKSGTASKYITIRSRSGSQRASLNLKGVAVPEGDQGAVHIINQSYIRIKNLDITGYSANTLASSPTGIFVRSEAGKQQSAIRLIGNHIYRLGNSHGTTFTQAELAACGNTDIPTCLNDELKWNISGFGIAIKGRSTTPMSDILIHGNELDHLTTGASESLVINGNVDGWTVSRNLIHDNNNIGIDAIGYEDADSFPASFNQEQNRARNGAILGNRVWNISSDGNPSYANYTANGKVSEYDRSADGIYVDGGTRNLIEGNLVMNTNIGIELAAEANYRTTDYNTVRNNIVAMVDYAALVLGGYSEEQGEPGGHDGGGSSSNNVILNNTFYTLKPDSLACAEQFRVSKNIIANTICAGPAGGQFQISKDKNSVASMLELTVTQKQPNPKGIFLSFRVPAERELRNWSSTEVQQFLHITAKSAAHDAGVSKLAGKALDVGTQDIDGQPRIVGKAIDIGADELPSGL